MSWPAVWTRCPNASKKGREGKKLAPTRSFAEEGAKK